MAKRQTIWLSTMMVLSLMLIGFYTVNNNTEPVPTDAPQTAAQGDDTNAQAAMEQSDYFVAYHLTASEEMSKKAEQLEEMIATGSPEEIEKAKQDLATLHDTDDKITAVTDMLVGEDYPDAIVEMKDNKINVIVQAQKIDRKEAVHIMKMVAEQMGVSSAHVTVAAHE
ncbi:MAG TPA: SpoIIIAH-like family protein [Bacilli bacterium]|nr:SpoIIIAH-like family protein [Bacilli bacterium]